MRLLFKATDKAYRQAIQDEASQGRIPMARLTFGVISGMGWGFLRPWEQQALFPRKGTTGGIYSMERGHEVFFIVRLWAHHGKHRHRNHQHPITGRYWRGLVWRRSWRRRWWVFNIPAPRLVLLDPDIVDDDPHLEPWQQFTNRERHRVSND